MRALSDLIELSLILDFSLFKRVERRYHHQKNLITEKIDETTIINLASASFETLCNRKMSITNLKNKHFSAEEKLEILSSLTENKNISLICKEYGIARKSFYDWKRNYEKEGIDGLKNIKRSVNNHPQQTSDEVISQIIEISFSNPDLGCESILDEFKRRGLKISSTTVQNILLRKRLGKTRRRIYEAERRHLSERLAINSDQKILINKQNPYFKYLGKIGSYPGEVLIQDTFQISNYLPDTYVYVVIDSFSCYTFAQLANVKSPEMAIEFLNLTALTYFIKNDLVIKKIITGKGKEFKQNKKRYSNYLQTFNISNEIFNENKKMHHGYVEKFKKDLLLQLKCTKSSHVNLRSLSEFVSRLVNEFNDEQNLSQWFPTFGRSPASIVEEQVVLKSLLN